MQDAATARAVAFDKDVLTNCVTVEGDLLNPGGLLTGGSRNGGNSVLAKLHALHSAESALEAAKTSLDEVESKLKQCAANAKASAKLEAALDQAEHALGLIEAKVRGVRVAPARGEGCETRSRSRRRQRGGRRRRREEATAATAAASLKKEIESFARSAIRASRLRRRRSRMRVRP